MQVIGYTEGGCGTLTICPLVAKRRLTVMLASKHLRSLPSTRLIFVPRRVQLLRCGDMESYASIAEYVRVLWNTYQYLELYPGWANGNLCSVLVE